MSVAAVAGVLAAITQGMQLSSELAPSIANDVSIYRQAFSTGSSKKQLMALRAHAANGAARLEAKIAQIRNDLDANREAVAAQIEAFKVKFEADGAISTEEFATLMGLQGVANMIANSYQHLQDLETLRQEFAEAGATPE